MHALWRFVFGNDAPVEVEIGPGIGVFLLTAADRNPRTNFFGVEHSHSRAAQLAAAIAAQGLRNARVIAADATCVIDAIIPPSSVAAYHIYFPDPWWKRRHHRRRLFTPRFAAALAGSVAEGGQIHLATDVESVFTLALKTLIGCAALAVDTDPARPRFAPTVFERKALARSAMIREATFVKRADPRPRHTSNAAPTTPAESPS